MRSLFLLFGALLFASLHGTPARADATIAQGACALVLGTAAEAEKGIPPVFGDLSEKSPRLARIVKAGMLSRKTIEAESAFGHVREVVAAAEDMTDEEVIHVMNRTGKNPTTLSGGNADLMIVGSARRRGGELSVTITHIRRMSLNWAENSGPNAVVTQVFSAVLQGIERNLQRSIAEGNPVESVVIRAGSVANKTLEDMFLSFGFVYDPDQLAKLEARQRHPIYRRTDALNRWVDKNIFRTEPDRNVGKRLDLVLAFKPAAP